VYNLELLSVHNFPRSCPDNKQALINPEKKKKKKTKKNGEITTRLLAGYSQAFAVVAINWNPIENNNYNELRDLA
jgi:hypothetical protein